MLKHNWLLYGVTITVTTILFVISLPLSSPHIFAYCLLSQLGVVPFDIDAFRIRCRRESTDSGVTSGFDGPLDRRQQTVQEYDLYERWGSRILDPIVSDEE